MNICTRSQSGETKCTRFQSGCVNFQRSKRFSWTAIRFRALGRPWLTHCLRGKIRQLCIRPRRRFIHHRPQRPRQIRRRTQIWMILATPSRPTLEWSGLQLKTRTTPSCPTVHPSSAVQRTCHHRHLPHLRPAAVLVLHELARRRTALILTVTAAHAEASHQRVPALSASTNHRRDLRKREWMVKSAA